MKRILSIFLLSIIFFTNAFAYTPNQEDKKIIQSLEKKIDTIIEKKWDKYAESLISQFISLKSKKADNKRLSYILDEIILHISESNNWVWDIEDIINNTELSNWVYIDNSNSIFIIFKEYLNLYNKKIDSAVYGQNGNIYWWCGTFWDKWDQWYKSQIENYYEIAKEQNAYFVMDLIKYDITKFQDYFKKECKSDWRLDNIEFHSWNYMNKISKIETIYFFYFYVYYNNWYIGTYENLFNNSSTWTTCNNITQDWNDFTWDRFDFLQKYMDTNWIKNYSKYFSEIENNFNILLQKNCNGTKIK